MTPENTAQERPLVLIADDEPSSIHVLVEALIADYRVKVATNGKIALELAKLDDQPDLIILDVWMPEVDGFEVCRILKSQHKTQAIPVMFVTSNDSMSAEFEGLRLEAIEFICKPVNPSTLRMRVRNLIKLKKLQDQLLALSTHDPLTGLANRRRLDEFLEWEWRRAMREGKPIGVIMFDIDHFKPFNDRYGHIEGDRCLAQVAATIASNLHRPGDLLARYGGEEFIGVLAATGLEEALNIAEACRASVAALQIRHEQSPYGVVTVSCGVVVETPVDINARVKIIDKADKNLYRAKNAGRNQALADESSDD